MPGYIFGVENMSAKMPSSIKILHVPRKYYSFSFFCSYLFLPLENRDGWECNFFHTSADFSNCAWWVQPGRHGCSLPHLVTHNCHPWAGKHFCVRSRAADDLSDAFSNGVVLVKLFFSAPCFWTIIDKILKIFIAMSYRLFRTTGRERRPPSQFGHIPPRLDGHEQPPRQQTGSQTQPEAISVFGRFQVSSKVPLLSRWLWFDPEITLPCN